MPARDPDTIVDALRRWTVPAQLAELPPDEWHLLAMPVLAFRDGEAMLVRSADRRSLLVETATGLGRMAVDARWDRRVVLVRSNIVAGTVLGRCVAVLAREGLFGTLAVFALALSLINVIPGALTGALFDQALPTHAPGRLVALAAGAAWVGLFKVVLAWMRGLTLVRLSAATELDLRSRTMAGLLHAPLERVRRRSVGQLLRVLDAAEVVAKQSVSAGIAPLLDASMCIVFLTALLGYSAAVSATCAVVGGIALLVGGWLARLHAAVRSRELEAKGHEDDALYQTIAASAAIKYLTAREAALARWFDRHLGHRLLALRRETLANAHQTIADGVQQLITLGTLAWGAPRCLHGEISMGAFLATLVFADGFAGAISRLLASELSIFEAAACAQTISPWLQHEAEPSSTEVLAGALEPTIVFDNVWFRYGDGPWILRGSSFEIAAGSFTLLDQPSGAGKTTTLRLIAGQCVPERGTVTIGGLPPAQASAAIGYVNQNAVLFGGSILESLRMLSGAPRARIEEVGKRLGLDAVLSRLPMGLDTVLPAGGAGLSAGECQLLLLTAAIASDRPLLLLDEAMSNLDPIARERVLLSGAFADRTVVCVSHERWAQRGAMPMGSSPIGDSALGGVLLQHARGRPA